MSYADSLGVLKTISHDKYIDDIRDGVNSLGAMMEKVGYNPADIRRYFRMVLAKLAGQRLADYCWDFFVWSRGKMLFRYAEENYDRKNPNSLGLLWVITFEPNEGIERCRRDVDSQAQFEADNGMATEAELEIARQKEEALRQKFLREHGGIIILVDRSALE